MKDYKIVLGIAPTRRDGFPDPRDAVKKKAQVMPRILDILRRAGNVEVVDIEWLNDEGMLVDPLDVPRVAEHFKEKKVDALFMPHCNYGSEEVVGMLGRAIGKPFLLWGPRDDEPPKGFVNRYTDTQCGLFCSGAALMRYGAPFTYIENCWPEDEALEKGIVDFIRTATVVREFRGMRVGQISVRPKPFLCVMVNESEMLEKFGVEVVPISSVEFVRTAKDFLQNKKDEVIKVISGIKAKTDCSAMTDEKMNAIAASELAFVAVAEKYRCTALCSECWELFNFELGIEPCSAMGDVNDMGLPIACETDIHGAITLALLCAAARGQTPGFLADLTNRHPTNENAELLWHCGPFPRSLAKPGSKPSIMRCQGQYEIKGGDITIARFGSINGGEYRLFADEAAGVDGPPTKGNYVWVEVDDWLKWERKFIYGPYIHHVGGIHGKYAHVLREACRYIPGLEADWADKN